MAISIALATLYVLISAILKPDSNCTTIRESELTEERIEASYFNASRFGCNSPWKYFDAQDQSCKCGSIPHALIKCDDSNSDRNASVLTSYCMTYNQQTGTFEVGSCIFSYGRTSTGTSRYYNVPDKSEINDFMCGVGLYRAGTICGTCMDTYYPLAYSVDMNCIPCPEGAWNWWKYLLMAFLPLTAFSFAILFLKINITSSNLQCFAFYSQVVSTPQIARIIILRLAHKQIFQQTARVIGVFYGFWNLDFFRLLYPQICLGTDTLQTLALDLIVGVYPLLLMMLTYLCISLHDKNFKPLVIICKPFRATLDIIGRNWEVRTSVIDSFATFILLSNVKLLSVAFDLLAPVNVYQLNSTGSTGNYSTTVRLYYDAERHYFGPGHFPYGIIGVLTLLLFVLLPTLLLMLYPFRCFQKLLNLFPGRWYILHTFVDSFQGCYKDGTEPGTRDCRWFACVYFVLRFVAMILAALTQNSLLFPLLSMLLAVATILLIQVQPFKANVNHYTHITANFSLFLALWYIFLTGTGYVNTEDEALLNTLLWCAAVVGTIPLVYVSVLVLHWIYHHKKFGLQLIESMKAWKRGYEILR